MIRRANSSIQPHVKKESKDAIDTHVKPKGAEVLFYFLLLSNQKTLTNKLSFNQ